MNNDNENYAIANAPRKRHRVLIVDDEPKNLQVLGRILRENDLDVAVATSAKQAMDALKYRIPDLFLLDIMMPDIDGFELAAQLNAIDSASNVPILFISALDDEESVIKAFNTGGRDYITKPFRTREVLARVFAHLELKSLRDSLETRVEEQVLEMESVNMALVEVLESANFFRDDETGLHIKRVASYARILSQAAGCSPRTQNEITKYASLHDIGKVGIPDAILRKPGKLDDEEMVIMKRHCEIGHAIIDRPAIPTVAKDIVLFHHERWDGSGYPRGLIGEKIPIAARIVAIADVYDALRSRRVYKEPFSAERTDSIIFESGGCHFDPALIEAFRNSARTFDLIFAELADTANS